MRKIIFIWLIAVMVLMSGCNAEVPDTLGAYTTVIDKLYNEDEGLNSDIKYLAIDTSSMKNLTSDKKTKLLKELEKYGLTVLDMTYEQLEEKGYIQDTYFKEGILFKIEDEIIKSTSITMDVSKYRSGLGAIGYDGLVVKYKNGEWEITKTKSAWIS